jgi:formate hydrogenlyase transcriptional activator
MSPPSPASPDRSRARYETLLEVAESIAAHHQLSPLIAELSRCLKRLVSFDFIGLSLLEPGDRMVRLHVLETDHPVDLPSPLLTRYEDGPTVETLRTRQPYYLPNLQAETSYPVVRELLGRHGIQSFCAVPLYTVQRDLGSLSFGSMREDACPPEDIEFMRQVARQVAVAVDNALNSEAAVAYEEQLARERDRLRALLEINNAVVNCLDSQRLFQAMAAALRRTFGLDYASLLIHDPEANVLRLQVLDFPEGMGAIREDSVASFDGPAGHVFQTREARKFTPEEIRAMSPEAGALFAQEGLRSLCCAPLITPSRVLGTLNLGSRAENFFSDADLQYFSQAAGQVALALDNALSYTRIEELNARLAEEKVYLEDEIRTDNRFEEIVGQSHALKAVLRQVETVAPTDSTVLICGETGTGKELMARAIHDLSSRRQGTFVKLNCAAIPTGLLESEMFGHEKGAFTGAIAQRIGRFELAHRGTMFLDEVGEIPLELQTKLLRVLQEREFERLGSSRTLRTDARLVAATNRDLTAMVEERQFRADLFYRLNVFPITVPPLRERREDIPLLVRYFVQQYARTMNRRITTIPSETLQALTRYHWPGNIRELQNFIERAVILTRGTALEAPVRELKRAAPKAQTEPAASGVVTLAEAEKDAILRALEESGGRVGGEQGAAARLGMKRTTLQAKMRKLGIESGRG